MNKDQWWVKELEGFWGSSDYQVTLDTRRAAKTALDVLFNPADLTDEEIYGILWTHFPISDKEKNATVIAVMTHCIRVALRKASEK